MRIRHVGVIQLELWSRHYTSEKIRISGLLSGSLCVINIFDKTSVCNSQTEMDEQAGQMGHRTHCARVMWLVKTMTKMHFSRYNNNNNNTSCFKHLYNLQCTSFPTSECNTRPQRQKSLFFTQLTQITQKVILKITITMATYWNLTTMSFTEIVYCYATTLKPTPACTLVGKCQTNNWML